MGLVEAAAEAAVMLEAVAKAPASEDAEAKANELWEAQSHCIRSRSTSTT